MGSARLKLDVALPCCVAIGRFAIQTILPAQDPFVIVCNECYARCAAQSGAAVGAVACAVHPSAEEEASQ